MAENKGMQGACYDCVYRGTIAGDCHSRCLHPMAQYAPGHSYGDCRQALKVDADPHGEKMGWFVWPINFDPVWLRHCDGFRQKGVANGKA